MQKKGGPPCCALGLSHAVESSLGRSAYAADISDTAAPAINVTAIIDRTISSAVVIFFEHDFELFIEFL